MSTCNPISKFAYVPQPFFSAASSSTSCTVELVSGWDSVENDEGLFDPDLSNKTTFWSSTAGTRTDGTHVFKIHFDYNLYNALRTSEIRTPFTVALIGCSLTNYPGESGAPTTPDLTRPQDERFNYIIETSGLVDTGGSPVTAGKGFAFASNNNIVGFCKDPMRSIISGGTTNLIVSGLTKFAPNGTAEITVTLDSWFMGSRNLKLTVGHIFIGTEIEVSMNPDALDWRMRVASERFKARDDGAVSGDGTLVRSVSGEIQKANLFMISGGEVRTRQQNLYNDNMVARHMWMDANFYDLIKCNTSYPLLFNPYPFDAITGDLTVDQFKQSARQNFFSIYGFMQNGISVQSGSYREGLESDYRVKFQIEETR